MANEIIKVYNTEANAIANGSTGRIDPVAAISGHAGIIANVAAEDIPFYIYKKFYYRFEANEPVMEFHIDWDDGEDNSPEKANIEIIKLESPDTAAITSHIYTEHKHFYPLLRVKSIDGYLSKWYTNDGKQTDGSGSSQNDFSSLERNTVTQGQNEFSSVSLEKTNTDRINSFLPANLPPIGVLKTDKKRIYSGIDNDMIQSYFNFPLLYAFSSTSASTKPNIKFTLQDSNGVIREHTLDSSSSSKLVSATGSWESQGSGGDLATKAIPLGNFTASETQSIQRITMNPFVAGGVPPNWDVIWTTNNDAYLDIHYESSSTGDINGNYHCRVYFFSATAGQVSEGAPDGATLPSGYTALKVGAGTTFSTDSEDSVLEGLRSALEAENDTAGVKLPFDVSSVSAGPNPYIQLTIHGSGAVTATSWTSYNTVNAGGSRAAEMVGSVITPGAGSPTQTTYLRKLLKVELDNATELADSDRVYINVWDAGGSSATRSVLVGSTDPDEAVDGTIAVLSNGNPIVEIEDLNTAYLDGTESFTRASNLTISTYKFDDDKLLLRGVTQATDADGVSDLLSGTFSATGTKELSYSFARMGDSVDSDGRFHSTYRLPRLQAKDNMTDATDSTALDTLTYSAIEHFNDTSYTAAAVEMPSDLESRGLLLYSSRDVAYTKDAMATWSDASPNNIDDTAMVFGGGASDRPLQDTSAITDHPRNFLFIAKTEKFDSLFFRMDNTNVVGETNWPPTVAITAYYGNGSTWYPLEIIDETQGLQVSGSIKFNMPHDWKKGHYTDIDGGDWNGPVDEDGNEGTTVAPKNLWTTSNIGSAGAYGLLISIGVKGSSSNEHKIVCKNIWPYNNSHSQLIKLEDPHHVSLNSIAIAQSISFGRSSKVISVEDKFGKADIRKIGAGGGSVRFGGIDLGNSDDNRKVIVGYQKNATPTFLDVEHKSGEKTRFFGIISSVTEDHPAGNMYPKWAVTMNISHVLELSSTGAINSDKISIGGALVDDGKYLL